ncbi:hypothetical protein AVEN_62229-1 [Araneus ventricosus]|uniref:Uncharacterized protein n=1 Tax=Araneus ventricosus TaxID=182803 RepID=A0A4Y2TTR8_ARAVE|nr:hypothetical protein AVEN_62229-1 [Araneus ventricosus]
MNLGSAMVTGANRGIGLELVRQLSRLNEPPKQIFATYRNPNSLKESLVIKFYFFVKFWTGENGIRFETQQFLHNWHGQPPSRLSRWTHQRKDSFSA